MAHGRPSIGTIAKFGKVVGDLPLNINHPRTNQNTGKKRRHRFCDRKDDMLAVWCTKPTKPIIDKLAIFHHGKTITLAGRQKSAKLLAIAARIKKRQIIQILARGSKGCWWVGRPHWRGWQQLPQMIKRPAGNIWFAPIGKQHLMIGSWRKALHHLHNVIFVTAVINWHNFEGSLFSEIAAPDRW